MSDDLVFRLRKRAEIRRQITTRKSVQNNEPDRISDLLEEAANRIAELEKKQHEILMEVKTSWTAISPVKGMPRESAQQLYELIKEITE